MIIKRTLAQIHSKLIIILTINEDAPGVVVGFIETTCSGQKLTIITMMTRVLATVGCLKITKDKVTNVSLIRTWGSHFNSNVDLNTDARVVF